MGIEISPAAAAGIAILVVLLGVVVTLAQIRLFSIDKSLKEIRDELRNQGRSR